MCKVARDNVWIGTNTQYKNSNNKNRKEKVEGKFKAIQIQIQSPIWLNITDESFIYIAVISLEI